METTADNYPKHRMVLENEKLKENSQNNSRSQLISDRMHGENTTCIIENIVTKNYEKNYEKVVKKIVKKL